MKKSDELIQQTGLPAGQTPAWRWLAAVITGALFLLVPAFLNGYPLVNSDVGSYVSSAAAGHEPIDRPMAYSILIRLFSLGGTSLWWVCVCQAMITSFLIVQTARRAAGMGPLAGAVLVALLSGLTSVSWVVSELIPDVYTAIAILSLYLLLLNREGGAVSILLYFFFAAAIGTHVSHVMIFGLLAGFSVLRALWARRKGRAAPALVPAVLALLITIGSVGWILKPVRESGHVFAVGALLQQGILKQVLDERCPVESYRLCAYKDSLNTDPNYFLWDESSPLYREGGWSATKPEYDRIVRQTWSSPRYIGMRIAASVRATAAQLKDFKIGDGNVAFGRGSHIYHFIGEYCPQDTARYTGAFQHGNVWPSPLTAALRIPNAIIYAVVILSLLSLLAVMLLRGARVPRPARELALITGIGILLNIWSCATFSQPNGRYGCRVMWLVPLCAVVFAAGLRQAKKKGRLPEEPAL